MSASENIANSKIIRVVALALRCQADDTFLVARRGPHGSGAGYWEFPGGKIESGETQEQAIIRETQEELGLDIGPRALTYIGENLCVYAGREIQIFLWSCELSTRPVLRLVDHDVAEFLSLSEIEKINLSEGDKPFISLLYSQFKK